MNILTPNRGRIGQAVANTFDKVLSVIAGVWSIEHNDDGTHAGITATSLTVSGDTTLEDVEIGGFVGPLNFGDADGMIGLAGSTITGETDYSDWPAGSVTADIVRPVLSSERSFVPDNDDDESLGFLSDASANDRQWRNGYFSKHVRANTFNSLSGYWERAYAAAVGEWTSFTPTRGAATGTWTGGTAAGYYMLIGKTLWIFFQVETSQNSNITASLNITIPGSFVAARAARYPTIIYETLGYDLDGTANTAAGGTALTFLRMSGAAIAANGASSLFVNGVIPIEIQ